MNISILAGEPDILAEIYKERIKQEKKWGKQSHPSVDPVLQNREGGCTPERMCVEYEIPTEIRAKFLCDNAAQRKLLTWAHITNEEHSEVVSAEDDEKRRGELVQLAAVCVAWIRDIDEKASRRAEAQSISNE